MSQRNDKKAQFQDQKNSGSLVRTIVAFAIVAVVAGASFFILQGSEQAIAGFQKVEASDGVIRIPLSKVDDGAAHYFTYTGNKGQVQFFVLKSSDGVYRAAFDACDVCYHAKKGYRQEGDKMVCNNCGMAFTSVNINEVKGGCNPAPLKRSVQGKDLVIAVQDIESGSWYFNS